MNLQNEISSWLDTYLIKSKLSTFVVGVSGGIDSALTSTLCAMTGQKTILVIMPIQQNPNETDRAEKHCNWLSSKYHNVEILKIDLTNLYLEYLKTIPVQFHNQLALANTRARIRMSSLYLIAGGSKGIVVGTGNKIEDFGVGFFTKYGDGGVDISPIADLMKSEVYSVAKDLGIIKEILDAAPTDGLWDDGRTDEEQLGVSYDELEWAMKNTDNNQMDLSDREKEVLSIYNNFRYSNLHKMIPIPIFKRK
ncbi:MAG: NAD(+) synthase [Candidatus Marinimicrobia bacterium]|nr:NAD(+) synthase [Candidatus Neomarinimicrobiota bacterium]|tara:strand:- start:17943 stop:18695 length:753 start_codon:yes stop_codon:yes gene_type:complete